MLQDGFGRSLTYLRVSLLKGCNLRCQYCMPERIPFRMDEVLSADELERLVGRFVQRGVTKVRLTGGEPTLRRGLVRGYLLRRETSAADVAQFERLLGDEPNGDASAVVRAGTTVTRQPSSTSFLTILRLMP